MNLDASASDPNEGDAESICFVQLTRMGDLIQTYRVSSSFKRHNPRAKLYLVARKKFALPLMFLLEQCFDEIFLLDIEDMVEDVVTSDDLVASVSSILNKINSYDFDELFNLSWSGSSGYICSLIKAKRKRGLVRNNENHLVVEGRWSELVYSTVMRGSYCPYNIVDMYKSIVGIEQVVTEPNTAKIGKRKTIVIHPFASNSKKRWKPGKWVEVIYKLLKTKGDRDVVVVGDENDRKEAELIQNSPVLEKYRGRLHIKIDDMGVDDLLSMLAHSEIFVGHDSFVSHLAALADVPIVTLAMGTVRVCETAPYCSRAYVVAPRTACYPCLPDEKCDFYKCHSDIPYQVVVGIVESILQGEKIDASLLNRKMTMFLMSSVDIFKTEFKESGFLYLDKITDLNFSSKEVFMIFYRMAYLCFFEMPEEKVKLPVLNRKTRNDLGEAMEGLEYVYNLYQFGKTYSKDIIEEIGSDAPCTIKIKSYSEKIDETERLQGLLGVRYPVLRPMIDFFIVGRRNLKGRDAVEIAEESFYEYHGASIFASIMYELCEKTIREYDGHSFDKGVSV